MKKITLLLLILSMNATAGNWITDLDQGKKLALGTNKLVLVDFWASWCGPCKKMDKESWSDPEVQGLMANYVPVQVDIDRDRNNAVKYGVRAIPYVFIMDGNGEVIFKSMSYMPKKQVMAVLKKYSLNSEFLQVEAMNYYKHQNYITSLRLAEKYLDYSLYLEPDVRNDFLEVGMTYLRASEKMLKKRQKNYDFIKEKIELMENISHLYRGNHQRVIKNLDRMDAKKVDANNQELYAFLQLTTAKIENNAAGVQEWKEYLNSRNSELYLTRYTLFTGVD